MAEKRPVVVYGASGFSGRLVVEFLREYGVPFVAAGRDRARLEEVLDHVPGIATADYEVADMYAVAGATSRPASANRSCQVSRTRRTQGASPPVSR